MDKKFNDSFCEKTISLGRLVKSLNWSSCFLNSNKEQINYVPNCPGYTIRTLTFYYMEIYLFSTKYLTKIKEIIKEQSNFVTLNIQYLTKQKKQFKNVKHESTMIKNNKSRFPPSSQLRQSNCKL